MAKKAKEERLTAARVDGDFKDRVTEYLDNSAIDESELIRLAVGEYMDNHPLKEEE